MNIPIIGILQSNRKLTQQNMKEKLASNVKLDLFIEIEDNSIMIIITVEYHHEISSLIITYLKPNESLYFFSQYS